jgi:hypothetical protein
MAMRKAAGWVARGSLAVSRRGRIRRRVRGLSTTVPIPAFPFIER